MNNKDRAILDARAVVPEHVLFQEVMGNSALLNLETETYYGLDDVGTRMWEAVGAADSVADAARSLADVYDAPLETIERDLVKLVADLRGHGLLDLAE